MTGSFALDGRSLTLEEFLAIVRDGARVTLDAAARTRIAASRTVVERAVQAQRPVYGVTTGFGGLSHQTIPADQARELQVSLVRSHASGTGPALPVDVVRGVVLLRANSLARGHSGVRPEVIERLLDLLNRDLVPWIPEQGSVGASGDLAPLAHLALALIGEGTFVGRPGGAPESAADVLRREGIPPLALAEKEGVALLNGTALMASYLALAVADLRSLLEAALVAAAISFDALEGNPESLDDRLGELRNSPEHRRVAATLRTLLSGSVLSGPGPPGRVKTPTRSGACRRCSGRSTSPSSSPRRSSAGS